MSNVPLTMNQLEEITANVAQELLEDWAINNRFTEEEAEMAKIHAVNDTVLVINNFMEQFNYIMMNAESESSNKLII